MLLIEGDLEKSQDAVKRENIDQSIKDEEVLEDSFFSCSYSRLSFLFDQTRKQIIVFGENQFCH